MQVHDNQEKLTFTHVCYIKNSLELSFAGTFKTSISVTACCRNFITIISTKFAFILVCSKKRMIRQLLYNIIGKNSLRTYTYSC